MTPESKKKTSFVTPRGLHQFKVLPPGLNKASVYFQSLMQHVLQKYIRKNMFNIYG